MKQVRMKYYLLLSVLAVTFLNSSCKKEPLQSIEYHEQEVITKVMLHFNELGGTDSRSFLWEDPDGPGGLPPHTDVIRLISGKAYALRLEFLDEINQENITAEILKAGDAHRVYFLPSDPLQVEVSDLDRDEQLLPLGLNSVWTTFQASEGIMGVVLRHYAEKGKREEDTVKNAKSATDVAIEFHVVIDEAGTNL